MIVLLVVGIAAIWVGACIWRRRYVRKRDRTSTLSAGKPGLANSTSGVPSQWGAPAMTSESPNLGIGAVDNNDPRNKGAFMPNSAAAGTEEQEVKPKKRGLFKGRS